MSFSEMLRKLRTEQGLSQQKLAKLSGVSQTAIYHWEKGDRNPKSEQILRVANALEVPVAELIGYDESRKKMETLEYELHQTYQKDFESPEEKTQLIEQYIKDRDLAKNEFILNQYFIYEAKQQNHMEKQIIRKYRKLNKMGREEAVKRISELTEIPRYTDPDEPPQD